MLCFSCKSLSSIEKNGHTFGVRSDCIFYARVREANIESDLVNALHSSCVRHFSSEMAIFMGFCGLVAPRLMKTRLVAVWKVWHRERRRRADAVTPVWLDVFSWVISTCLAARPVRDRIGSSDMLFIFLRVGLGFRIIHGNMDSSISYLQA